MKQKQTLTGNATVGGPRPRTFEALQSERSLVLRGFSFPSKSRRDLLPQLPATLSFSPSLSSLSPVWSSLSSKLSSLRSSVPCNLASPCRRLLPVELSSSRSSGRRLLPAAGFFFAVAVGLIHWGCNFCFLRGGIVFFVGAGTLPLLPKAHSPCFHVLFPSVVAKHLSDFATFVLYDASILVRIKFRNTT